MRTDVVRAHRALAAAGQADLVWGHVSVRDPDGRGAWMKAAGWGFEEVDDERVVLVAADGEVVQGAGPRHLEFPIHTEVLRARPDVQCVVHTHSAAATAFASLGVPVRAIDHDGVLFAEPDVPRFTRTGALISTPELGAELAGVLGGARACLLARHGLVTAGPDVAHAVMYAVLLDRACRKQLDAMAAGGPASWSSPAEAEAKRAECWPPSQIEAGWRYLNRLAEKGNR
ncbi:class II aldolase/adducin family protein [Amycolatopsis sp. NPDC051903]|uniref:class II aldolase/adducin family protein n=1 Tax=Amycolatopsis sp. NPDC051903 TaxID=3363936 RepID=UPI0037945021